MNPFENLPPWNKKIKSVVSVTAPSGCEIIVLLDTDDDTVMQRRQEAITEFLWRREYEPQTA